MNINPINKTELEELIKQSKKFNGELNLGVVYIIFVTISIALIYWYTVYQNQFYTILIPFASLWSILVIITGISLFKVKNTASFSLGFFITILASAGTIASIFVRLDNLDTNFYPTSIEAGQNIEKIYTDIDAKFTGISITGERINNLKSETSSNYDKLVIDTYIDDYGIRNFNLKQTLFPPGIGDYYKKSNITIPDNIATVLDINLEASSLTAKFDKLRLVSGEIFTKFSNVEIMIDSIEENTTLDITAFLSQLTLKINKDINVILTTSSTLSTNNLVGIIKNDDESNVYRTKNNKDKLIKSDNKPKEIVINLTSTISRIQIIQE